MVGPRGREDGAQLGEDHVLELGTLVRAASPPSEDVMEALQDADFVLAAAGTLVLTAAGSMVLVTAGTLVLATAG